MKLPWSKEGGSQKNWKYHYLNDFCRRQTARMDVGVGVDGSNSLAAASHQWQGLRGVEVPKSSCFKGGGLVEMKPLSAFLEGLGHFCPIPFVSVRICFPLWKKLSRNSMQLFTNMSVSCLFHFFVVTWIVLIVHHLQNFWRMRALALIIFPWMLGLICLFPCSLLNLKVELNCDWAQIWSCIMDIWEHCWACEVWIFICKQRPTVFAFHPSASPWLFGPRRSAESAGSRGWHQSSPHPTGGWAWAFGQPPRKRAGASQCALAYQSDFQPLSKVRIGFTSACTPRK